MLNGMSFVGPARKDDKSEHVRIGLPFFVKQKRGPNGMFRYGCRNLSPKGRCMDYANRPALCRQFQPMSDPLCILHPSHQEAEVAGTP